MDVPKNCRVVVIGAGIAGTSVAYHLTALGWSDVVVLDQGPLFKTGGSTSHAPGLVFVVNFSKLMSLFAQYTTELYKSLQLDGDPVWHGVGGMEIAWTPNRLEDLKRKTDAGKAWGIETYLLGKDEARKKIPLLSDQIYGAMYTPADGIAEPHQAAEAMGKSAMRRGARFFGSTKVTAIHTKNGKVTGVETDRGTIATENIVCAAGIWGPRVGRMAGVALPLQPMRHQFALTEPIPEMAEEVLQYRHPVLRHQDRAMYFRQEGKSYIIGSYDHEPLLVNPDNILSHEAAPIMPSLMEWSDDAFVNAVISTGEILPPLKDLELTGKVNGMFSFTPDGMPVLGESPAVKGFWSAEAVWITHAGGVGKAVAEWMVEGEPDMDLREADISRFHTHQLTDQYVKIRGTQQYREVYDIIHPQQPINAPRNIRLLPYHDRLRELGACFVEDSGWERPQYFKTNRRLLNKLSGPGGERTGWEAQHWSAIIGAEHRAVRERVGLFDLTPFAKFRISGRKSLSFLEYICSNKIDRPVGTIIYTSMLTPKGGIKCDLTVTRISQDEFMIVTGGGSSKHDKAWISKHMPTDGSVQLHDETDQWACIGVWGPKSRNLLERTTTDEISDSGFPYMTSQTITIADISVVAFRISYVGELGWELYVPKDSGLNLWDTLWAVGKDLGVVAAGLGAFDSLRLEKGYRLWGSDIHTEYNPYEAGLGFTVRDDKPNFIGRDELTFLQKKGINRKLSCMVLDDPSVVVLGNEPIWGKNKVIGHVTSANYGYSVDNSIAYGYLTEGYWEPGTKVEISYFGTHHQAIVHAEPLWDPNNERITKEYL